MISSNMKTSDFDYDLHEHFIAQTPANPRDHSHLMVYSRSENTTEICHFFDIINYLKSGDVIVINTTKVIPARMFFTNEKGKAFETLLLKKTSLNTYEALVKGLKRLKFNEKLIFGSKLTGEIIEKNPTAGTVNIRFSESGTALDDLINQLGKTPLPPYIKPDEKQKNRYQTVYANQVGSSAAPTAGLHWTPELMQKARDKGAIFCEVLLHVGLGTFRPVQCENLSDHKMHSEFYELSPASAQIINHAKSHGNRVICVGTTSLRTLEGIYAKYGTIKPDTGETDIFIYPPYEFKVADALITNFHLPKSTLLMLVSAFAGREKTLELYETAKQNDFKFFSFGDCMLII